MSASVSHMGGSAAPAIHATSRSGLKLDLLKVVRCAGVGVVPCLPFSLADLVLNRPKLGTIEDLHDQSIDLLLEAWPERRPILAFCRETCLTQAE